MLSKIAVDGHRHTEPEPGSTTYYDFISIPEFYHLVASDHCLVDKGSIGGKVSQEYADLAVACYAINQAVTFGHMRTIDDQVFGKLSISTFPSAHLRAEGADRLTAFRITADNIPLRLGSWEASLAVCQIDSGPLISIHRKQTTPHDQDSATPDLGESGHACYIRHRQNLDNARKFGLKQ